MQVADAQDFDLGRQFEVVFAGELIEHLDDVHGFLASVRRHLQPGGRLVLTTPNAFYVGNFVYRFGGHGQVHPEHTCWYCEDTLRHVLWRNGFDKVDISFTGHTSPTPHARSPPSPCSRVAAAPGARHDRRRGHHRLRAARRQGRWASTNQPVSSRAASTTRPARWNHGSRSAHT